MTQNTKIFIMVVSYRITACGLKLFRVNIWMVKEVNHNYKLTTVFIYGEGCGWDPNRKCRVFQGACKLLGSFHFMCCTHKILEGKMLEEKENAQR